MVMMADRDISAGEKFRMPYVDFVEFATNHHLSLLE